jgi:hypothetical protein
LLFEAHAVAYRLYRQAPIIPAIDHYNLAPEAYGAVVARTDGHGVPPGAGISRDGGCRAGGRPFLHRFGPGYERLLYRCA